MADFLYNGTELPDIYTVYTPEVQAQNPYATILWNGDENLPQICLFASTNPLFVERTTGGNCIPQDTKYKQWYIFNISAQEWGEPNEQYTFGGAVNTGLDFYVWSNYPYLYDDGELCHPASDPIPVGSAPEVEPIALTMGIVGRIVRGLRGK